MSNQSYIKDEQAKAWASVYLFCKSKGMKYRNGETASQCVLRFISNKIKKSKQIKNG